MSSILRRFALVFAVIPAAILLGGCASAPPLNPPTGQIGGIEASKSKVVLRQQQETKQASNIAYVFPAGDYRAAFEDATGVYYEAPSKIIMNEKLFGLMQVAGRPFTGGIFLDRTNPKVAKMYFIMTGEGEGEIGRYVKAGRPSKPSLPKQPFQFQLTKA